MKDKTRINEINDRVIVFIIDLIMLLYLGKVYNLSFGNDKLRMILNLILLVILCVKVLNFKLIFKKDASIFLIVLIYIIYIFFSLVFRREGSISLLMTTLMFPCVFFLGFLSFKSNYKIYKIIKFQNMYLILLILLYLYSKFVLGHHGGLMINSIYYIVLCLPFLFLLNNENKKLVGIIIVISTVFISMKRTALICTIGSIIIYYWKSNKIRVNLKKIRVKKIFNFILITFLIIIIFTYISNYLGLNIFSRFISNGEDLSSGRLDIYKNVIKGFSESNIIQKILGHGYYGVVNLTNGMSAHNDFLEILYNFGILGLVLLLSLIYCIFRYSKLFRKNNFKYSAAFDASIFIFIIMCTSSHIIFIPTYVVFIAVFWTLCLGEYEKFKDEKNGVRR